VKMQGYVGVGSKSGNARVYGKEGIKLKLDG
jgi:hypothetical protein